LAVYAGNVALRSGVPVHVAPNQSFAAGPQSQFAEHPVSKVKRSYETPTVECPVTAAAVTQAVGRE
jgi:hypothetical protein